MYWGSSGRLGSLVMPLRGVGADLVLVDDPFEGGAVAEVVVEDFGRDAFQGEEVVVDEGGLVRGEFHLVHPPVEGRARFLHPLQGIFRLLLIVDVEFGQARPGLGKTPKIRGEGDAGQFPAEVGGVFLPVGGMVQEGVDVMEDVPLGDGVIVVMGAELLQGPVGEVFPAVGAVFGVDVEGEALGS